jgi:DNA repair protein RadC
MTELDKTVVPMFHVELVRDRDIAVPRKLENVEKCAAVFHALLDKSPIERMIVLYMDGAADLVGAEEVAVGGLERVQVEMKNLFRGAIVASVQRIVLGHNHSQGDVKASDEDIKLTAIAAQYGLMLGIEVWDHIVVSPKGDHYSIYDHPERMIDLAIRNIQKTLPPPGPGGVDPYGPPYKNAPKPSSVVDLLRGMLPPIPPPKR